MLSKSFAEYPLQETENSLQIFINGTSVHDNFATASEIIKHQTEAIAHWVRKLKKHDAQIIWGGKKPLRVLASMAESNSGIQAIGESGNISQPPRTWLQSPPKPEILSYEKKLWVGGTFLLSEELHRIQGVMMNSERPMGLVLATPGDLDADLQIAINAASVALLQADESQIQEAVPRRTANGWHPEDREALAFLRRDTSSFEISYRAEILDSSWRRIWNRYTLVDNCIWVGTNFGAEEISNPLVTAR